jgi:hypothetical protein
VANQATGMPALQQPQPLPYAVCCAFGLTACLLRPAACLLLCFGTQVATRVAAAGITISVAPLDAADVCSASLPACCCVLVCSWHTGGHQGGGGGGRGGGFSGGRPGDWDCPCCSNRKSCPKLAAVLSAGMHFCSYRLPACCCVLVAQAVTRAVVVGCLVANQATGIARAAATTTSPSETPAKSAK